jgi:hypothetical protein
MIRIGTGLVMKWSKEAFQSVSTWPMGWSSKARISSRILALLPRAIAARANFPSGTFPVEQASASVMDGPAILILESTRSMYFANLESTSHLVP